jgi:16S rRNA (guanine966-N2)-methyltransferase
MRVIAGTHKGRRLASPRAPGLRPTSDKVREALFSILHPYLPGARFLDLYAGTGAVGIEALSRGAQRAVFVESDPGAYRLLRRNLADCGLQDAGEPYSGTAEAFLREAASHRPYDIVFADPPYRGGDTGQLLRAFEQIPLRETSLIVLEHASKSPLPAQTGRLTRVRQYRYGDTTLSLFRLQGPAVQSP